jgi:hypothetical protein
MCPKFLRDGHGAGKLPPVVLNTWWDEDPGQRSGGRLRIWRDRTLLDDDLSGRKLATSFPTTTDTICRSGQWGRSLSLTTRP